jgi:MoxR-like ATPase
MQLELQGLLKKGIVKPMSAFDTVEAVQQELGSAGYIASDGLAVSLFLALAKQRALFLEGEAGVGKTEIAKMLARVLDRDLIRLQCYEGLDINQAAYEWNYARQLVEIQAQRQSADK